MTERPYSSDDLVGCTIQDRYRIVSKIGEGGMGVVYKAEHLLIGRHFAIKTLHSAFVQDDHVVARFHREARAAAAIGNEHIIAVNDMGYLPNGSPYIVLELLEGNNLSEELENTGPFPISRAVKIAIQCCHALSEAHNKGIVHRDVKPENIFLTKRSDDSDFVKILDFGISKIRDSALGINDGLMTKTGSAIGTPYYMSPEQASGDKAIDARTDIYAMGVVLFQMLIGRVPFEAPTFPLLILKIMMEPPPSMIDLRSDIPVELLDVTNRALFKDPAERFTTMTELIDALSPFTELDGEPQLTDPGVEFSRTDTPQVWESKSEPPKKWYSWFPLDKKTYFVGVIASAVVLALLVPAVKVFLDRNGDRDIRDAAPLHQQKPVPAAAAPESPKKRASRPAESAASESAPENSAEPTTHSSDKPSQVIEQPVVSDAKSTKTIKPKEKPNPKIKRPSSRRPRRKVEVVKTPLVSSEASTSATAVAKPSSVATPPPVAAPPAPAVRKVTVKNRVRATVKVAFSCGDHSKTVSIDGKVRKTIEVPQQECSVKCSGIGNPRCPITLRVGDRLLVID